MVCHHDSKIVAVREVMSEVHVIKMNKNKESSLLTNLIQPNVTMGICMPVLPYLTVGTFTGDDNNFVRSLHSWTNLTRFASVDTATYSFSSSNDVTSALPPSSLSMSF